MTKYFIYFTLVCSGLFFHPLVVGAENQCLCKECKCSKENPCNCSKGLQCNCSEECECAAHRPISPTKTLTSPLQDNEKESIKTLS